MIYARKHRGPRAARLEALGVALGEATHARHRPNGARTRVAGTRAALRAALRPA